MDRTQLPIGTIYVRDDDKDWKWVVEPSGRHRGITTPQGTGINVSMRESKDKPFKIVGMLPPDQLDAREWKDAYKTPYGYDPEKDDLRWSGKDWRWHDKGYYDTPAGKRRYPDPILVRAVEMKPARLPIGTRFRFRSWPERWADKVEDCIKQDREFTVCVPSKIVTWDAEGQCFVTDHAIAQDGTGCFRKWAGVLPTDDIEILSEEEEPKASSPKEKKPSAFTWRGWFFWPSKTSPTMPWWARKGEKSMSGQLHRLLDSVIAEAVEEWSDIMNEFSLKASNEKRQLEVKLDEALKEKERLSLMSTPKFKVAPTYMATIVRNGGGSIDATINKDSGSTSYPAGTKITVKNFDKDRPGVTGTNIGDIIAVRKTKLGGWKLVANTSPQKSVEKLLPKDSPSGKKESLEAAIGIVTEHSGSHAVVNTGKRKIRIEGTQGAFNKHSAFTGDVVRLEKKAKGWQVVRCVRAEDIGKHSPEMFKLRRDRDSWRAEVDYLNELFKDYKIPEPKTEETSDASPVSNATAQKGRKGLMKKAAILLVAGALAGNLPVVDMYSGVKGYFAGSPTIVTGDFEQRPFCEESGIVYPAGSNVIVDGETGSTDIRQVIAAPLFRDRGFPLTDAQVGFVIRNEDGSTRILMNDNDITVGKDDGAKS